MPQSASSTSQLGKQLLFGLLLLLLALPAVQTARPLVSVTPLDGFTEPVPKPEFSWDAIQANTYQPMLERHVETKIGFRPWLVRTRNQLVYWLFKETKVYGIFPGKDDVLFQQGPINAYLGRLFLGEDEINFRLRRLRRVQDSLQAHGTQLLFLIAPGKARIFPDMLPDTCTGVWQKRSNYDACIEALRRNNVNFLDTTPLFLRWQKASPYPLFPRGGAHWSGYATTLVADTLFRRLEQLTHLDFPDFSSRGVTVATEDAQLRYTDNDLMAACNLIWNVRPYPMAYPNVVFGPGQHKQHPNVLIIGDSFSQSFYGFYPYYQTLFDPRSRFWFYNEDVYWPTETPGESRRVSDLNLKEQLAGRNVVLLVAMEENLHKLGFGFIDNAFQQFCPLTAKDSVRIQEIEKDILGSEEWRQRLSEKAQARGISLEEAAHNDAMYMQDRER